MRHFASLLLAALFTAAPMLTLGAPVQHVREIPLLQSIAQDIHHALERHDFDAALGALAQGRELVQERGAAGRLAALEFQAIECQLDIERRNEQHAFKLCAAAYEGIVRDFGEPVALRSAAALPLAETLLLQADFSRGLAHLEAAESAMRTAWGDAVDELADAEHLRGGFQYFAGEFAAARASYLRAHQRMRAAQSTATYATIASAAQAALMTVRLGNADAAIDELRPLLDRLPTDPRLRARARGLVLRNLAQAFESAGRPQDMVRTAEEGWTTLRDGLGENDPETLELLSQLATNLGSIGRHADALALQEVLLPKFRALYGEVSELVIVTLNNMAFNLSALEANAEAVRHFRDALELSRKLFGPDHPDTLWAVQQLAVALMKADGAAEALPLLVTVEERNAKAAPPVRAKARSDLYLARVMVGDSPVDRARLVGHAEALARQFGVAFPLTVQTATRAGELLLKQGVRERALAMHELALQGVEQQLAGRQWVPSNRRAFLSRYIALYRTAAALTADVRGECARALRIAESARGHGLLEAVNRRRALDSSDVPPEERARIAELVAARERLESEAALAAPGTTQRVQRDTDASAAALELAQLEQTLARRYPGFARLRSALEFDLATSRRALAADEAFVEYVVAPHETIAIVVTRGAQPTCIPLGPSAPIIAGTVAFRRTIEAEHAPPQREARRLGDASMALSQRLLAPLWPHIGRFKRLVFSPDGPLAAVPFDLLPAPKSGSPLVAEREVAYAQSLAVLAAIRASGSPAKTGWSRDLLAFGGPRYGTEEPAGGLAALVTRSASAPTAAGRANRVRSASDALEPAAAFRALGLNWPPLPGAAREARTIASLFRRALAVTGAQATEERLQQFSRSGELGDYRYLLFAAHAYLSTDIPSLSAIVLSVPGTPQADGYVTAAEWPGYRLRSQLVVLSGCETGLGAEGAGDGILGLPYALFVAGNRNTLVSLWKIADEATTAFMVRFFSRLHAGEPQGAALARTKREFMRHARYGAPRHWAAFVLYGG